MLFNTSTFAFFFIIVFALYWAMNKSFRAQNLLILGASFLFYGWWDVRFLYLFILTTTVDFYCALMIERGKVPIRQRAIVSLVLLASAFFCVTVQWDAVTTTWIGLRPHFSLDWPGLFPTSPSGWAVLGGTLAAVVAINGADGWLTSLSESRRRKFFLAGSVISNFAILGFFKYYNFFATSFADAIHTLFGVTPSTWTLHIILPVGISFYTFQSLAYTIDVYRGKVPAVERYLSLATCLSFFPLLVAGPIERPHRFFPQFFRPRTLNAEGWREGIWLIVWGLFKKMVVADRMAVIVAGVFGPYDGATPSHAVPADGLRMLLGVYAFALQIYGDFSGYSDIAKGTARLLGFEVVRNFNLPYFAISPSDFWQRWHISLSSWLRDYLYIPLGGNRGGTLFTYRNLFLTMLLGGLWHGANWTFILWGAYHGLLLIGYRIFAPRLGEKPALPPTPTAAPATVANSGPREPDRERAVTTYSTLVPMLPERRSMPELQWGKWLKYFLLGLLMFHFTCLGWLLFRAQNVTTIGIFLKSIFTSPAWSPEAAAIGKDILFYSWFLILFQIIQASMGTLDPMKRLPWFIRLNIWIFLIMGIIALAETSNVSFIYFAF